MTYQNVISIHGVPRSGTSWLGQIFASHPDVAYRYQPLFAYRFKDRLNLQSTSQDIDRFLNELYNVEDDEFILDVERRKPISDYWQKAIKSEQPKYLVMKMVRYHHLLRLFLENIEGIKIVGIVRHPCAVINSWLQAPKEFRCGWDPNKEWRYAPKKNAERPEEFNGFEKWKEVALMFLKYQQKFPENFYLLRYETLANNTESEVKRLFSFSGLEMEQQTLDFVNISHSKHDPDPYSVIRKNVSNQKWKHELDPSIANAIIKDVQGTNLEQFLY
jgi:hypothetical protein